MGKGFFSKLVAGLSKTHQRFSARVRELLGRKIDAETLDELEELLILADMGVETTTKIIDDLRTAYREKRIEKGADFLELLKADLKGSLEERDNQLHAADVAVHAHDISIRRMAFFRIVSFSTVSCVSNALVQSRRTISS